MLIKFKNKNVVALNKMINDGQRLGGIPSHIEVSSAEAVDIMLEVNRNNSKDFSFASKEGNVDNTLLFRVRDMKQTDLASYLSSWKSGAWIVTFKKIPLNVVDITPQNQMLHS